MKSTSVHHSSTGVTSVVTVAVVTLSVSQSVTVTCHCHNVTCHWCLRSKCESVINRIGTTPKRDEIGAKQPKFNRFRPDIRHVRLTKFNCYETGTKTGMSEKCTVHGTLWGHPVSVPAVSITRRYSSGRDETGTKPRTFRNRPAPVINSGLKMNCSRQHDYTV
jgi:hypothetical protein